MCAVVRRTDPRALLQEKKKKNDSPAPEKTSNRVRLRLFDRLLERSRAVVHQHVVGVLALAPRRVIPSPLDAPAALPPEPSGELLGERVARPVVVGRDDHPSSQVEQAPARPQVRKLGVFLGVGQGTLFDVSGRAVGNGNDVRKTGLLERELVYLPLDENHVGRAHDVVEPVEDFLRSFHLREPLFDRAVLDVDELAVPEVREGDRGRRSSSYPGVALKLDPVALERLLRDPPARKPLDLRLLERFQPRIRLRELLGGLVRDGEGSS